MNMQLDELGAAHAWLDMAQRDYQSAAEFGTLGLRLMALGAPAELVSRTQQAGLLAVDQHQRSMDIVKLLGGPMVTGADAAELAHHNGTDAGYTSAAIDTFHHGVVGHGHAVNCLRRGVKTAAGQVAEMMSELLVNNHTQLCTSRDIVAWCVEMDPSTIVDLHNAARRLPAKPPTDHHVVAPMSAREVARAGLCDETAHRESWKETVLDATWWLTTALV